MGYVSVMGYVSHIFMYMDIRNHINLIKNHGYEGKLCFGSYDLHDVADTKVMSEFLRRDGNRYWTTIDGVRQLYRRVECKMCFEVIEKLRGL